MEQIPFPDFPEHATETAGVWDALAAWWDDAIGDGNATQDLLVEPVQERLLDLKEGETVLDIACGAGRFTRRMAGEGVHVVAFDHSERFIARARERTGLAAAQSAAAEYAGKSPSGRRGSNPRPSAWEADALPTELRPRDP